MSDDVDGRFDRSETDARFARVSRVLAKYPALTRAGVAPIARRAPPVLVDTLDAGTMTIGVRCGARVRWGTCVGFRADDTGLLVVVAYDRIDLTDPDCSNFDDTVAVSRIVGLAGRLFADGGHVNIEDS